MATLFNPFYFSIDGNGVPRAGATLSFFQTGTSTPQNTYTDSTLATANANPVVADSNGLFPAIYLAAAFDYKAILKDSSGTTIATRDPLGFTPTPGNVMRSYLTGLTLSAAGSTGTFGIAAGLATDSTNVSAMSLAGAYTKTTGSWMAGSTAGSLDTGTVAINTWYHVHLIQRPDTGIVDVLTSLSVASPTLPANYTLFRRIGAVLTDGSSHYTAFVQDGDDFQWLAPVQDISSANPGTSAVTRTLSVPTGINVKASLQIGLRNVGSGGDALAFVSDLATTDTAASSAATDVGTTQAVSGSNNTNFTCKVVRTNTAAQVRSRLSLSNGSVTLFINTIGWADSRGKGV